MQLTMVIVQHMGGTDVCISHCLAQRQNFTPFNAVQHSCGWSVQDIEKDCCVLSQKNLMPTAAAQRHCVFLHSRCFACFCCIFVIAVCCRSCCAEPGDVGAHKQQDCRRQGAHVTSFYWGWGGGGGCVCWFGGAGAGFACCPVLCWVVLSCFLGRWPHAFAAPPFPCTLLTWRAVPCCATFLLNHPRTLTPCPPCRT